MRRLKTIDASWMRDTRGGVALAFGLAVTVLFAAVGLAVDFSRAYAAKQSLQAAVDAATMSAARSGAQDEQAVGAALDSYLAMSNVLKHGALMMTKAGRVLDNGTTIESELVARMPTRLLSVMGYDHIDMKIESRVMRGLGNVEIALVLDTTASMQGTKLDNVKSAASELVDALFALPDAANKVKVALVPFAQYVNVGLENRNASWMDVPPDTTSTATACYDTYPNATKSNCRMQTFTATNDGVPYTYSAEVCDWDYGMPVNVCAPYTTTSTWNGCAGARSNPLNIKDEQYSTRIPGIRNVSCPGKIQPLSKSVSDIKNSINTMAPYGETYIPAGLVWGWRALSNRAPFTESAEDAATSGGAVRKYLVLMTDGYNTKSPRYPEGDHEGSDATLANTLTREACDNIKADHESKIDIFTIAFAVTDEGVKDILRYCATPGGAFFDAVDYSKLLTAFGEIGNSVSVARFAK